MRQYGLSFLFLLTFIAVARPALAEQVPRVFVFDADNLVVVKARLAEGDSRLASAAEHLRREADAALKEGPFSVTEVGPVPPSGDRHDYMSVGPYWWPDPKKEDGLPYIRRDGRVNPEYHDYDPVPLKAMAHSVQTLALAYYLTDNPAYGEHAARLLRTWFLDDETRMNPNLQYGQAIPGRCSGRGIGLIETVSLIGIVDAVGMLKGSPAWREEDQAALQAWFGEFLTWMLESRYGRDEAATKNNHGTWYDAQVASFALFVGREELARRVLHEAAEKRIAQQIEPDGRQPLELARTKSFGYSVMNLRGMFTLATLGERVGVELWSFQTEDGRSIRKALDCLAQFASGEGKWEHEQIGGVHPDALYPLLRQAALVFDEPAYEGLVEKIPGFNPKAERTELLWPAQ